MTSTPQHQQIHADLRAAILGRPPPPNPPPLPKPEPPAKRETWNPDEDIATKQRYYAQHIEEFTTIKFHFLHLDKLSAWEREHYERYGRIFFPETDEGRRIVQLQKNSTQL